jgi:hypothetical protein
MVHVSVTAFSFTRLSDFGPFCVCKHTCQDDFLRGMNRRRMRMIPDGSCLFRCFSQHLFGMQTHHHELRLQCVQYMKDHEQDFIQYTPVCSIVSDMLYFD